MSVQWWERINRKEVIGGVAAISSNGGCLVLQGDDQSGRSQAASLSYEELSRRGFQVERVVPEDGCSWMERRALAKAWDALAPAASGLSLSGGGDLELSQPLRGLHWPEVRPNSTSRTGQTIALVFDDVGRDSDRHYNLRPAFGALATYARSPVVVTYDPTATQSQWPLARS